MSSNLHPGFQSILFPSVFPTKIFYTFLICCNLTQCVMCKYHDKLDTAAELIWLQKALLLVRDTFLLSTLWRASAVNSNLHHFSCEEDKTCNSKEREDIRMSYKILLSRRTRQINVGFIWHRIKADCFFAKITSCLFVSIVNVQKSNQIISVIQLEVKTELKKCYVAGRSKRRVFIYFSVKLIELCCNMHRI